jgi:hypothetical protein
VYSLAVLGRAECLTGECSISLCVFVCVSEMVWLDKLQRLMIAFTGNFDQLQYTDPVSGETVMAVFNMHDFKGAEGSLEVRHIVL